MCTTKGQRRGFQLAEAHPRNTEVALQTESQQRELAMTMARKVPTGQAAVWREFEQQMERAKAEQTAQASLIYSVFDTDRNCGLLSGLLQEAQFKSTEFAQYIYIVLDNIDEKKIFQNTCACSEAQRERYEPRNGK